MRAVPRRQRPSAAYRRTSILPRDLGLAFEASLMAGQAQQNAITRRLAAWAAILAVLTAVADLRHEFRAHAEPNGLMAIISSGAIGRFAHCLPAFPPPWLAVSALSTRWEIKDDRHFDVSFGNSPPLYVLPPAKGRPWARPRLSNTFFNPAKSLACGRSQLLGDKAGLSSKVCQPVLRYSAPRVTGSMGLARQQCFDPRGILVARPHRHFIVRRRTDLE